MLNPLPGIDRGVDAGSCRGRCGRCIAPAVSASALDALGDGLRVGPVARCGLGVLSRWGARAAVEAGFAWGLDLVEAGALARFFRHDGDAGGVEVKKE